MYEIYLHSIYKDMHVMDFHIDNIYIYIYIYHKNDKMIDNVMRFDITYEQRMLFG